MLKMRVAINALSMVLFAGLTSAGGIEDAAPKKNIYVESRMDWPMDSDFLKGLQLGAYIAEDDEDEEPIQCPPVKVPNFMSWIEYLEPAKIALLKYANEGKEIPEIDLFTDSIERVFKIWKVFDTDYEGD